LYDILGDETSAIGEDDGDAVADAVGNVVGNVEGNSVGWHFKK
jgi:outer membrane lipoprotein SlyB